MMEVTRKQTRLVNDAATSEVVRRKDPGHFTLRIPIHKDVLAVPDGRADDFSFADFSARWWPGQVLDEV